MANLNGQGVDFQSSAPAGRVGGVFATVSGGNGTRHASSNTEEIPRQATRKAAHSLRRLSHLAHWLDDRFAIPGTNVRFGMDSVVGLVPGIGDVAGAALSSYIVLEGRRLGVPKRLLIKMIGNIAVDAALGVVPIIGDLADIQWKANRKNVQLLIDHLNGEP